MTHFHLKNSKRALITWIVCLFAALMVALTVYSLYFGVSPHDEAFYVSIPYRFILGDRPFIDEYSFTQTAAFFTIPFFKVFLHLKGSSEGIILFSRYLHFTFTVLLAGLVFFTFKKVASTWEAILLALPCIVFVPFNIHGLSYNTLAILFSTAAYLFGFLTVIRARSDSNLEINKSVYKFDAFLFSAGAFHAFALICYPTLLFIPFLYVICLVCFLPKIKVLINYSFGVLFGGIWFLLVVIHTGLGSLLVDYHYNASFGTQGGGLAKLFSIASTFWMLFPNKILVLFLLISIAFLRKKLVILTLFITLFLSILGALLIDYHYIAAFGAQGSGLTKLVFVSNIFWMVFPNKMLIVFLLISVAFSRKKLTILMPFVILYLFVDVLIPAVKENILLGIILFIVNFIVISTSSLLIEFLPIIFTEILSVGANFLRKNFTVLTPFIILSFFAFCMLPAINENVFLGGVVFLVSFVFINSLHNFFEFQNNILLENLSISVVLLREKLTVLMPFIILSLLSVFIVSAIKFNALSEVEIFISNLIFITPVLFFLIKDQEKKLVTQLFVLIYLPSFFSGIICAWTSSNGVSNNVIGSFPGLLVAMFYLLMFGRTKKDNSMPTAIILSSIIVFITVLQYFNLFFTYEDLQLSHLKFKINSGPFENLYTTENKRQYYAQLEQDIRLIYKPGQHILFFDDFPAGYLFSDMRPATNSTFLVSPALFPSQDRGSTILYYALRKVKPDIIVKMLAVPSTFSSIFYQENEDDPLNKLTKKYQIILRRSGYEIYK